MKGLKHVVAGSCLLGTLALLACPAGAQQEIKKPDGSIFMEEVQSNRRDATPPADQMKHPVDLSDMGVSTDPQGNIVPLIENGAPVEMPYGSRISVYNEGPGWPYQPLIRYGGGYLSPYGYPYGYRWAYPQGYPIAPYYSPWAMPGAYAPYMVSPAPPLGFVPQMSVTNGWGGYNFQSDSTGLLGPFTRNSYRSSGWLGR